jgi:hypothetical protein
MSPGICPQKNPYSIPFCQPTLVLLVRKLGKEKGWDVHTTGNGALVNDDYMSRFTVASPRYLPAQVDEWYNFKQRVYGDDSAQLSLNKAL